MPPVDGNSRKNASGAPPVQQAAEAEPNAEQTPANPAIRTEWDSALIRSLVSFFQLTQAYYQMLDADRPERRAAAADYFPRLLEKYQAAYGGIKQHYNGHRYFGAAVLTDQDRIDIIAPNVTGKLAQALGLVNRCDALTIQVNSVLDPGETRRTIMETIFGVTVAGLDLIDETPRGVEPSDDGLELVDTRLAAATALFQKAAQRQARVHYFSGVMLGLLAAIPLMAAIGVFLWFLPVAGLTPTTFLGAFAAGALGGTVSVLSRLSFGKLVLDIEAGSKQLCQLGVVRPLLGGVFGLAVYWLAAGGLVPVKFSDGPVKDLFFAGLSFLAGFSERFAQDMFSVGQQGLSKQKKPDDRGSGANAGSTSADDGQTSGRPKGKKSAPAP